MCRSFIYIDFLFKKGQGIALKFRELFSRIWAVGILSSFHILQYFGISFCNVVLFPRWDSAQILLPITSALKCRLYHSSCDCLASWRLWESLTACDWSQKARVTSQILAPPGCCEAWFLSLQLALFCWDCQLKTVRVCEGSEKCI